MYKLQQNKIAHIESEIGKYIPTQGDKPNTGCVGSLSLVRKRSRPKAHSYMDKWELKDCMHKTAFHNITVSHKF